MVFWRIKQSFQKPKIKTIESSEGDEEMDIRSNIAMVGYKKIQPLTSEQASSTESAINSKKDSFQDAYASELKAVRPDYHQPSSHQFGQTIKNMAENVVSTLKTSEEVSYQGVAGKADAQAVVQAMANAEMTLRAALSIRDKVVEAYQEILKMPI